MQTTYCPHCMRLVRADICPYCGSDVNYPGNPMHLPVGYTLLGQHTYILGACRGQGGFGVTYIALDAITGGRVAIKEYFPTYCSGRNGATTIQSYYGQQDAYIKGKEHFLEEARTLQSLSDLRSVVNVVEFFEANNTAYLVMEFLDGCSLKDYVMRNGKMPAQRLFQQMRPMMADLDVMHKRGVIHRDIAPDNIILQPDGSLKLIDFGAARSYLSEKSMSVVVKKGFAPVEQYMRSGMDAGTDVYSFAATLYYCITGTVPPDSADRQYGNAKLKSPIVLGVSITTEQEAALERALQIQPAVRTKSIAQLSAELLGAEMKEPSFCSQSSEECAGAEQDPSSELEHDAEPEIIQDHVPVPEYGSGTGFEAAKEKFSGSNAGYSKKTGLLIKLAPIAVVVIALAGILVGFSSDVPPTRDSDGSNTIQMQCTDHSWTYGNCGSPAVCENCGAISDTATEHQWMDFTDPECIRICGKCDALVLPEGFDTTVEIENVDALYYSIRSMDMGGKLTKEKTHKNHNIYRDKSSNIVKVLIPRGNAGFGDYGSYYSRSYYFSEGKLIYAFLEGDDSHHMYFYNDRMFHWRHSGKNSFNYTLDFSEEYLAWEKLVIAEAGKYSG